MALIHEENRSNINSECGRNKVGVLLLIHSPTCFVILILRMAIPLVQVRHNVVTTTQKSLLLRVP